MQLVDARSMPSIASTNEDCPETIRRWYVLHSSPIHDMPKGMIATLRLEGTSRFSTQGSAYLIRLEPEVKILFKGERPKAKLKLVIITDDETSELDIGKEESDIQWFGDMCVYMHPCLCSYRHPFIVLAGKRCASGSSFIRRRFSEASSLRVPLY